MGGRGKQDWVEVRKQIAGVIVKAGGMTTPGLIAAMRSHGMTEVVVRDAIRFMKEDGNIFREQQRAPWRLTGKESNYVSLDS